MQTPKSIARAMPELENFHLARNDFEQCTRNTFRNLLQDGQEFADVTLACGADTQLKAHKVAQHTCWPFIGERSMSSA